MRLSCNLKTTIATAMSFFVGICASAAWSQADLNSVDSMTSKSQSESDMNASKDDATSTDSATSVGGTSAGARAPLTGGVEQREIITLPGNASKQDALPKLTLEIPKLDKLPPVPKFLQAGATFNDSEKQEPLDDAVWYKIPSFMAGNWQSSEKTITSSENLQTGRGNANVRTEEFVSQIHQGCQQDKAGGYWQFQNTPFLGHSMGPNDTLHYSYVQSIEPISSSEDRFVRRSILTKADVDGHIVQSSQQVELIQAYTPLPDGTIREDNVARIFDNGRPKWQNTSIVVFHKTRPYSPQNRYNGFDMRQMFSGYLSSHGMADLVPQ